MIRYVAARSATRKKTSRLSSHQSSGIAGLMADTTQTTRNNPIRTCNNRLDRNETAEAVEPVVTLLKNQVTGTSVPSRRNLESSTYLPRRVDNGACLLVFSRGFTSFSLCSTTVALPLHHRCRDFRQ